MRTFRAFAAVVQIALLFGFASRCSAGLGPENVAVIINEDSWASKAIANEFIALYRIPPANVIYINRLPDFEQTDIEFLRAQLLNPIIKTLEQRGLAAQIDCIAWSSDIPYIVDITKDFASAPSATVGRAGSITGLTYLYKFVFADRQHAPPGSYTLPGNNRYFRRAIAPRKGPPPTDAQQSRLREAARLIHGKAWTDAEATLRPLLEECPDNAEAHFCLALCSAHRGDLDEAVQSLQRAAECGWGDWRAWQDNEAFAPLRNRKEFKEALEKSKAVIEDVEPSLGFRSDRGWNAQGERTESDTGVRYLLSVMLAVTSGRGNSVPEALDALRAAARADGARPKGVFYFIRNENIRSTVRDWLFPSAVEKLRTMGLSAELEEGIVPMNKPDVMGAVIGAAEYDWKSSGSRILPGAICEDFTSAGGILTAGAGQTPLTSLIACGAAASSGTVTEPIAIEEKFPSPFIHVHYARGCTLAEAFYQSVATPYQLLIVGDPLCAPWRDPPNVVIEGLAAGQTVNGAFSVKASALPLSAVPVEKFELYMDGRRLGQLSPGQSGEGDAKRMLEGYHELRVVAVTGGPIEERTTTILPFTVDKSGRRLAISGPEKSDAPWDRPLRLHTELAGAAEIQFFHNLRPIGVVHGDKGAVEIDPQFLGQGLCRIWCMAVDAERKPIAVSAFIELRVVPPAPAPAIEPPEEGLSEAGLLLTAEGGAPVVVADAGRKNWLSVAGVKEGRSFTLEGFFDAPEETVYQFQVRGNVGPIVEVDGRTIQSPKPNLRPANEKTEPAAAVEPAGDAVWTFLPVSLAKGLHRLRVTGVAVKGSTLDIRFGGRGTQSIGADFKHAKPPAPAPAPSPQK
jgi:tetratricopeptide (TPR) repeat protein